MDAFHTILYLTPIDELSEEIPQRSQVSFWIPFIKSSDGSTFDAIYTFDTLDPTYKKTLELSAGFSLSFSFSTEKLSFRILSCRDILPSQIKKWTDDNDTSEFTSVMYIKPTNKEIPITYTYHTDKYQKILSGLKISIPIDEITKLFVLMESYYLQFTNFTSFVK